MARKIVLAATVSVLCFASTALGQQWAYKMFQVREHNFGTVARDAKAEFEFPFKNIFVKDVHIAGVRVSCGCTSV